MLHFLPRLQKEEAKIAAWENLQKAKAEAAVRKLEVNICSSHSNIQSNVVMMFLTYPCFRE